METYKKRLQSFGFNAIVVDGHDVEELCKVSTRHTNRNTHSHTQTLKNSSKLKLTKATTNKANSGTKTHIHTRTHTHTHTHTLKNSDRLYMKIHN